MKRRDVLKQAKDVTREEGLLSFALELVLSRLWCNASCVRITDSSGHAWHIMRGIDMKCMPLKSAHLKHRWPLGVVTHM